MKKIEELRKELNMSLKEFSEYYEIPYNTVRQWEKGERTPPNYIIKLLNEVIDFKTKGVQMKICDENEIFYVLTSEYYDGRINPIILTKNKEEFNKERKRYLQHANMYKFYGKKEYLGKNEP